MSRAESGPPFSSQRWALLKGGNRQCFKARFWRPTPESLLDQGTQVLGSLHAARVEIGAGVTFRHHRYLERLKIDPVCVRALEEALKMPFGGQ